MKDDSKSVGTDGTYQGHKNWTHWNVALWLSNDEPTYRMVCDTIAATKTLNIAARCIQAALEPRTPDGARYSVTAIRAAPVGWES